MKAPADIDLLDPALFGEGDPHGVWRWLREHQPVYWHRGRHSPGFWCLTKHADIARVSRETDTFVSGMSPAIEFPFDAFTDLSAPITPVGGVRRLNHDDAPFHGQLKRLVARFFVPGKVEQFAPRAQELATSLLARSTGRASCELVTEVAAPLPFRLLCELIGIPVEAQATVEKHVVIPEPRARHAVLTTFFSALLDREDHREGLIAALRRDLADGALSRGEVIEFCNLLVEAGHETVRNALVGGCLAFCAYPEQLERLRCAPELLDSSVEEVLRWTSPIARFGRFVVRDCGIRGQPIKARQRVVLWFPSANRDEDVFEQPDVFDVARAPNEHLALGVGPHYCLGASLARMQLRIFFSALAQSCSSIQLAGRIARRASSFNLGFNEAWVCLRP